MSIETETIVTGITLSKKQRKSFLQVINDKIYDARGGMNSGDIHEVSYSLADASALATVLKLIEDGECLEASKKARSLDTAVREIIPGSVWNELMMVGTQKL